LLITQIFIGTKSDSDDSSVKSKFIIPPAIPRKKYKQRSVEKKDVVDIEDIVLRLSTLGFVVVKDSIFKMINELPEREKIVLQAHIGKMEKYRGPIYNNFYVEELQ
jgi:hypothetical protein